MVSTYATELWMSKSEDNPQKNKLRKQNYSLYKTQLRLTNYISVSYLGTNKRKVLA
jgi:hypothetical protein